MQSKDKKILMITYYFPPLGGIPPRRSFRFAKNLPAFGWKPFVLTVKNPSKREAAWDYKLLDELEELPINVIRTKWKDIIWFSEILGRLKLFRLQNRFSAFCRRFPPDPYIGWYPSAVKEGLKVIKQNKIDVIYSNSAPFTAHLIGLKLQKTTGLPWVADFRDPWIDDPLRPKGLFKWQEKLESRQELKVIENADHIITASRNYALFLREKYPQAEEKISHIYNGYDWPTGQYYNGNQHNNCLEFVYAGAFYGSQSPISFLKALESLMIKGDITEGMVKFVIIGGHGDESWKQKFIDSSILKAVTIVGFIPNYQIREKLLNASCLLIQQARERGNLIVLGKTFEYISVGRPILALVSCKSECLDILEQSGCLFEQAEPDSEEEIMEAILYVYENWKNGKLKVDPKWEYISQFDGMNLTNKFANILDKCSSRL
mgnify:CR=1 FL=1